MWLNWAVYFTSEVEYGRLLYILEARLRLLIDSSVFKVGQCLNLGTVYSRLPCIFCKRQIKCFCPRCACSWASQWYVSYRVCDAAWAIRITLLFVFKYFDINDVLSRHCLSLCCLFHLQGGIPHSLLDSKALVVIPTSLIVVGKSWAVVFLRFWKLRTPS